MSLGLVDEVTAKGEGVARAEALAAEIAKRGPLAVQMVKAMINAAEGEDRDAPIEGLAGALTAFTEDLAEGVAAFRAQALAHIRRPLGAAPMTAQTPITLDTTKLNDALARFPARPRDVDRRPRSQGGGDDDRAAQPGAWRRRHPRAARRRRGRSRRDRRRARGLRQGPVAA